MKKRVLEYVSQQALLRPGDRVAAAVSGGADSVALLRLLIELRSELGIVLSVVHFNHGIRGEASDADERFVRELASVHGLDFYVSRGDAPAHASTTKTSLETAARELRYAFFRSLIANGTVCKIATAHTLDDQAETVLLRLVRGTGSLGLAGIFPSVAVESGAIVRPMLTIRRSEIEQYLRTLGQCWHEDVTNADPRHTRNRVRHALLPFLEREFNPSVRDRFAEMAEIARAEEAFFEAETRRLLADRRDSRLGDSGQVSPSNPAALDVAFLRQQPLAIQRRLIRVVTAELGLALDFAHVEDVRALLDSAPSTSAELMNGWRAVRAGSISSNACPEIRFCPLASAAVKQPVDYDISLPCPGEVLVPQLHATFRARLLPFGTKAGNPENLGQAAGYTIDQLIDPVKLPAELRVRNWRAGDRFWPARMRAPKKVKELLQLKHVTGTQRALWPVVVIGDTIIWMRGFPVPENLQPAVGTPALIIEEVQQD